MREIKFRAWDKQMKRMMNIDTLDMFFQSIQWIDHSTRKYKIRLFSEIELMQYTGLKDKNGKEIYEGDILHVFEVSEHKTLDYNSKVEWFESGFQVREPSDYIVPLACFHNSATSYPLVEIEAIGNIYENPELLEGSKTE